MTSFSSPAALLNQSVNAAWKRLYRRRPEWRSTGRTKNRAYEANMKIATIVGARPQFIKAAVVSRALWTADEVMIHTGQHYDDNMSEIFFRELGIARPRYN